MNSKNLGRLIVTLSTAVLISQSVTTTTTAATTTNESNKAKCVVLKNVVRKNYQLAQDIWRNQGFVINPAKDSLGLKRWPVIDSNWFVVSQYPKAGTCLRKGASVTASVRKYTD